MAKTFKKIQEAKVSGKTVFLRVDFNVLDKKGRIESDFRIKSSLPTIKWLVKEKAKIIIAAHAGRPEGKVVPQFSLKKISVELEKLLKRKIILAPDCVGPKVQSLAQALKPGQILMLENLRFHIEEEDNAPAFAKQLAALADIYINDAFGVSHRENASVSAITKFLPSYAGLLLQKEITSLSIVRDNPEQPLIVIIGGAKASDKIPVIKNLARHAHRILLGGAAASTFLKSHHYSIGQSLFEPEQVENARHLLHEFMEKIVLPLDVVVARSNAKGFDEKAVRETNIRDIHDNETVMDIGDYTYKTFVGYIKQAKTIFWAGPVGNTDYRRFSKGTIAIAKAISATKAYSVVGGGETIATLEKNKLLGKISHASTGGGAALEFLSGKELPGIKALLR